MRKNYPLQIIIGLAVITGIILLSAYGKIDPANHRFLTTGWEYSWNDGSPQEPAGRQWLSMPKPGQPEGYNGQKYLWLRVPIPQGTLKSPTLFTEFVHQSLEVYVDGARVYQYGSMPVATGEKLRLWLPYHIIPLPEDAPGKMAYFRIASSASSIGIFGGVEYGPLLGMYKYKNVIECLKFSAVALAAAAALWSFVAYWFHRRERVYLAFTANALCGAGIVLGTTYNSFLWYPEPGFWNNWIVITGLGWKIAWLQFLVFIIEADRRRTVQRLVWLTAALSCAQMAVVILQPQYMVSVLTGNIVYSIGCYAAVLYFCRDKLRHSREVQLYVGGSSVWMVALSADTLHISGVLPAHLLISWIGQMAEAACLGAILLLRYAAVHRQLGNYAQELEFFNRNLENLVKERTEELSVQKACLEQLFEHSPDAMAMLDDRYRIINVNPAFEGLFGYSAAEAAGREIDALLCTGGEAAAERLERHRALYVDTVRHHRDGSAIAVALTAYPFVAENRQIGIYVIYHDISRRILAERILRERERKYRLLAENTNDVIWLLSLDKEFLYISPSLERLLGFTPEELLYKPLQEKHNRPLLAAIDEVVAAYRQDEHRQAPVLLEEERRGKDGSLVWIESSLSIALDESGELLGVLGVTRNISIRKYAEELLSHAYERKRRNQFFYDLASGALTDKPQIYSRARYMRIYLPPAFALCFCHVRTDGEAGPEWQNMLWDEIVDWLNRQEGIEAWNAGGGVGMICSLDTAGDRQPEWAVANACLEKLTAGFPRLRFSIGLADYADSVTGFADRFRHACAAARIGSLRREENFLQRYEECGVDEVFETFADTQEAVGLVNRTLGPLLEYDRQNGTDLLPTLKLILLLPSLKDVAEKMGIHPKTVIARKQRIEKVLDISLDSFETRLLFGTALRLDSMLAARKL